MAEALMQNLVAERTLVSLKITNHNEFAIEDSFDGVPYQLKPNEAVSVPADAALHIFGWYPGVDIKAVQLHVQKRWGWNTPEIVNAKLHEKYFAALSFKPVTYKIVEVPEEVTELEELPNPITSKNGKTTPLEASA